MDSCVITADIRQSRQLPQRQQLQQRLLTALDQVNRQYQTELLAPFAITLGDEWQGVLRNLCQSFEIAAFFIEQFYPNTIAIGIGEGAIDTELRQRSVEMDGPVFHRSRQALDLAKEEDSNLIYATCQPQIDLLLNVSCRLLQIVRQSWTPKQFEKVRLYKYLKKENEVARTLNVSQADINKTLASTNGRVYLQAEAKLNQFLRKLYNQ